MAYREVSDNSLIKAWFTTALLLATTAAGAYFFRERGFDWYAFAYPLPVFKDNFDKLYLIDFTYLSALIMGAYWLVYVRITPEPPRLLSVPGVTLAIGASLFLIIAINFEFQFLPQGEECFSRTLGSGIEVEVCDYNQQPRNLIAIMSGLSLFASLMAALRQSRLPELDRGYA